MSRFLHDDDFFSPVRLDTSTINESNDSLGGSLSDYSNIAGISLTNMIENKITWPENVMESSLDTELKYETSEIINVCTPVQNENSFNKSVVKRHSSKVETEKIKDHKIATKDNENGESLHKKQELPCRENTLDSETPKSDKQHQKCRSASLLPKNKNSKHDSVKDAKKRQKDKSLLSKCGNADEELKSNDKLPEEKKLTNNSSGSLENSCDINLKNSSVISTESQSISNNLKTKKSNSAIQQIEKINVKPNHTSYEASIEKMIRNSISSESAKIRQLMYMQQMSFYREMNKMKDKMEKEHLVTREHLFKIIEELMQMNACLRLALSNKD